jgi:hypothetical protein
MLRICLTRPQLSLSVMRRKRTKILNGRFADRDPKSPIVAREGIASHWPGLALESFLSASSPRAGRSRAPVNRRVSRSAVRRRTRAGI